MIKMFFLYSIAFLLLGFSLAVIAQDSPSLAGKLPGKTALLLTPEFCEGKVTHGLSDNPKVGIPAGEIACMEFEPALKDIFADLTTIHDPKDAGDSRLILTPKFVDVAVTTGITSFSDEELTLFLQWTATDASGRMIWLETVAGAAKHRQGNLFTARKNARILIHDAVQDAATESAKKMSSSAELRKYAH